MICVPSAFRLSATLTLLMSMSGLVTQAQPAKIPPADSGEQAVLPAIPPIKRVLPPEGIEVPTNVRERLVKELEAIGQRFVEIKDHELSADIFVFIKAVTYALENREFYDPKDFAKADALLKEANLRLDQLAAGKHPWTTATGTVVRGFHSGIDGFPQPYGAVIPKDHDLSKVAPLYVWLHGRGDKQTDLHFIYERMSKPGQIAPPGAIVVHAFGRQCVGYKHAGEVDVIEATMHAEKQYNTDPKRRVLIGFSMGGAGAWHVGAHFADHFRVVAPGAGFAETAQYVKLKPEDYPAWYEQKLWGHYDTPAYVRNLFNCDVFAYSGELDRQIQAARVMEAAYQSEGRELTHLIGPKTEHKYEPTVLKELLAKIDEAVKKPAEDPPKKVSLQTRTLRYARQHWLQLFRLEEHWQDTRVDATLDGSQFDVTTKNVAFLGIMLPKDIHDKDGKVQITIDGQNLVVERSSKGSDEICAIYKTDGKWAHEDLAKLYTRVQEKVKRIDSHGPIDDAYRNTFVVVTPSGKSKNARFQAWQEFELEHFRSRWRSLMRAELRVIKDTEVTDQIIKLANLSLWGDADSNSVIKQIAADLPIKRAGEDWVVGTEKYDAATHVPVMIYPNPLDKNNWPPKYVVLNSGLTFREAHDKTNSQQNPKLPDWAMIDLTQVPDASAPGKIVNAGFFDEKWELKPVSKK
ncbi:Putative esterase [Anatilimnocola aggregata]|uniref:Esterase n=1 Tax=Anatilimnocola aggregata TaxID=2528021 RepID=A0A517YDP6_9BACT|nr:prolyl oligopeptidase family serine peptidase [Anatilimnocola aggregata]QDU28350.1 Putative esterase [Anatilimnocola aggregata]